MCLVHYDIFPYPSNQGDRLLAIDCCGTCYRATEQILRKRIKPSIFAEDKFAIKANKERAEETRENFD